MCRIRISVEFVGRIWIEAEEIGNNTARIDEIPVALSLGLGDIVEFDPSNNNQVMRIIQKGSKTCGCTYDTTGNLILDRANKAGIKVFLARYAIQINFVCDTIFVMAVPLNMTNDRLSHIVSKCPVKFDLYVSVEGNL